MWSLAFLAVASIVAIGTAKTVEHIYNDEKSLNNVQKDLKQKLEDYGLTDSYTPRRIIDEMLEQNLIDDKEYKAGLKLLEKIDGIKGQGLFLSNEDWAEVLSSGASRHQLISLYNKMVDYVPELRKATYEEMQNFTKDQQQSIIDSIPNIAKPTYLDTNVDIYQRDVDPVKLWTGQELADLHNIDFDPNNYYDLIKATTSAAVDYGKYTSEQMNQASMVNDTDSIVPYLDSLRNVKAEAISNGATLGAQRANELLSNINQLNTYATNQNDVAAQRYDTLDSLLLNDASAKLTARNYFDQLAQSLANDSSILYANDTARFGQDWRTNADMFGADQELIGNRILANANMNNAYNQAQARVNAARSGASQQLNEYDWLFKNFLVRNDYNVDKTFQDMQSYIMTRYTGKKDMLEYVNDKNS